jgi:hydroxymethylpyrimidine/phosphomethylpyrimidine kinase
VVLVCAGHDPSGGAGVDADREAITSAGGEARCVVTTDTDQDGKRVTAVRARDPRVWAEQARAELEAGAGARALKFGARGRAIPVVVDPVLAASGGERFLDGPGTERLLEALIPAGVVLTPNLVEVAELCGSDLQPLVENRGAREDAARRLLEAGAAGVVLKDGHGAGDFVTDLVLEAGGEPCWLHRPRIAGHGIHGSGCRHASFLATRLARGDSLEASALGAGDYLAERIARARALGLA